ncbi:Abortive infection C-terminus [Palleronia marisminoris]|uniref:Abortive infection protein-like C-terminal domain-containing protein n=1 Tax=Palleronia marisminoris TaxID=315423 RepID=A0A1Y5RUJ4_9RHOB|nr:abortive infection family protein [Palleronia marisminoris]SFG50896.1 Abortive infection C-terminus [Palleronia marisminoris]SLN24566.1 hypothetical protein PAM7066_00870 [Palleronia marisminoris]
MNLSEQAIEFLVGYITGNSGLSPYRSGPQLVDFFNRFGADDLYGNGFPSRHVYARERLANYNSTPKIKNIIEAAFDWSADSDREIEDHAFQFSRLLAPSGFKLRKDYQEGFIHNGMYVEGPVYFEVVPTEGRILTPPGYLLRNDNLRAHVSKANSRIDQSDYAGAISICYTLIESFLKLSLDELSEEYREGEGDIKKLYKQYSSAAGLAVSEQTDTVLKPLLSGLTSLVGGFYEVSNKASDRHAAKYSPNLHHAKLVVSLTFAFCEFLIESSRYRRKIAVH